MKELKCPVCGDVGYSSYEGNAKCSEHPQPSKVVLSLSHGFLDVLQKPAGITIELHDHDTPECQYGGRPLMYDADEVIDDGRT